MPEPASKAAGSSSDPRATPSSRLNSCLGVRSLRGPGTSDARVENPAWGRPSHRKCAQANRVCRPVNGAEGHVRENCVPSVTRRGLERELQLPRQSPTLPRHRGTGRRSVSVSHVQPDVSDSVRSRRSPGRIIWGADEQRAVQQDVVVLAARLGEHHAGVAGGKVRPPVPDASDSTQSGSEEHHSARWTAERTVRSRRSGSPWATRPPRLPAESLVAV